MAVGKRSSLKFWGFSLIFLQRLKLAISRLAGRWALPRPITKSHPEEKWAWPWARGPAQIWGFPFNISATTEGNKPIIKSHLEEKGRGPGLRELFKIWGFPFNIFAKLKLATSNFACSWGLPRLIVKSHRK